MSFGKKKNLMKKILKIMSYKLLKMIIFYHVKTNKINKV